ncbi:MAG: hypothetical protein HY332_09220 [Chloroflexi bacterium]|nr:hypothetical protein [Chloroflexota bacterium]
MPFAPKPTNTDPTGECQGTTRPPNQRSAGSTVIAAGTGSGGTAAKSEALALRWDAHVDLDVPCVYVEANLERDLDGKSITDGDVKTSAGYRPVPLTSTAVSAVRAPPKPTEAERRLAGPLYQERTLVLPNKLGRPDDRDNVNRVLTFGELGRFVKRAGRSAESCKAISPCSRCDGRRRLAPKQQDDTLSDPWRSGLVQPTCSSHDADR